MTVFERRENVPMRQTANPRVVDSQTPGVPVSTVVANPTYVSIPMEIMVNRPAVEVWKRVGKYCDNGEWMQIPCTITSGKDGELGTVRSIGNEILVGKTELSYTYTQPVREGRPYILVSLASRLTVRFTNRQKLIDEGLR
jgi:hypothetical protein